MSLVEVRGLVHFSLPANDVEESLRFYTDVLGMRYRGPVGETGRCVVVGDVNIILVGRTEPRPVDEIERQNGSLCHHAFSVSSEDFDRAVAGLATAGATMAGEVEWRRKGTFTGRSIYFYDPTGNRLELNDPKPPTWPEGV